MGSGAEANRHDRIDHRRATGDYLGGPFFGVWGGVIMSVAFLAGVLRVAMVASKTASVQGSLSSRENSRPCRPDASRREYVRLPGRKFSDEN